MGYQTINIHICICSNLHLHKTLQEYQNGHIQIVKRFFYDTECHHLDSLYISLT